MENHIRFVKKWLLGSKTLIHDIDNNRLPTSHEAAIYILSLVSQISFFTKKTSIDEWTINPHLRKAVLVAIFIFAGGTLYVKSKKIIKKNTMLAILSLDLFSSIIINTISFFVFVFNLPQGNQYIEYVFLQLLTISYFIIIYKKIKITNSIQTTKP